ncbi:MAG: helix-turn-helix transcriptional regulator [Chloroflexota bacterium]
MNNKTTLGTLLKVAREEKSLSLRAVEKEVGISNAYLSQIESDKIKQPSPNMLFKLAELYDNSYNELLNLAGYPTPDDIDGIEESSNASFVARLGSITDEEQNELLDYLAFLRSKRSRKD